MTSVKLEDLVGRHILTGVDFSTRTIDRFGYDENCNVVNFVLDGKTYTAVEDPGDGYRSAMDEIFVSDEAVSNLFPPIEVMGKMCDHEFGYACGNDVIGFYEIDNAKLILAVGTGNADDWYPYWVAEFNPEDMSMNEDK